MNKEDYDEFVSIQLDIGQLKLNTKISAFLTFGCAFGAFTSIYCSIRDNSPECFDITTFTTATLISGSIFIRNAKKLYKAKTKK